MNQKRKNRSGFSLIEMLVVIGIVVMLMGIAIVGYSGMVRRAQRTNTLELVSNATTALSMILQETGAWPKPIIDGMSGRHQLDNEVCAAFVRHGNGLLGLSYKTDIGADGVSRRIVHPESPDRFGLLDAYAQAVVRKRANVSADTPVPTGGTIKDHILYYSVDADGDGIVEVPLRSGNVRVRASACVWAAGADGDLSKSRSKGDDVYSWRVDQEVR